MGYIYGIYANKELIYIGKTTRDLEVRFKEHRAAVYNNTPNKQRIHCIIQECLAQGIEVKMRCLYEIADQKDLRFLEDKLIFQYQPIGNVQGHTTNRRKDCCKS